MNEITWNILFQSKAAWSLCKWASCILPREYIFVAAIYYNIVQWICSGLLLSFILSIYTLQSSRDKLERYFILSSRLLKTIFLLSIYNHTFFFPKNKPIISSSWIARFVRETVAESSIPVGEIAKVEWYPQSRNEIDKISWCWGVLAYTAMNQSFHFLMEVSAGTRAVKWVAQNVDIEYITIHMEGWICNIIFKNA